MIAEGARDRQFWAAGSLSWRSFGSGAVTWVVMVDGDAEVYRRYSAELIRFATVLVGPHEAEDLLATAVVKALGAPRWPVVDNRRAYLSGVSGRGGGDGRDDVVRCIRRPRGAHRRGLRRPWISDTRSTAAAAYHDAAARRPSADAVVERFGDELHAPLDHTAQQWWTDGAPGIETLAPLFERFDDFYGAGEFTWSGLWTATDPPPEALAQMVGAWELETGPVTRWWLPVQPEAHVYEIHRPEDWAHLVAACPRQASPHPGWELPGLNQRHRYISPLLATIDQRGARASIRRHLVPDWRSVAGQHDGIHLSWAGFITAEGCIVDLAGGDVTMLRYWFSERTLWLADVFTEPRLAADPQVNLSSGGQHHPALPPRIAVTRDVIAGLLGRRHAL